MKKQGEKTKDLINEKFPKLNEKTRRKIDYLFIEAEIVCKEWKTSKT